MQEQQEFGGRTAGGVGREQPVEPVGLGADLVAVLLVAGIERLGAVLQHEERRHRQEQVAVVDQLAQVANDYGMHATADYIRNNPNYMREVCLLVGPDIRRASWVRQQH